MLRLLHTPTCLSKLSLPPKPGVLPAALWETDAIMAAFVAAAAEPVLIAVAVAELLAVVPVLVAVGVMPTVALAEPVVVAAVTESA